MSKRAKKAKRPLQKAKRKSRNGLDVAAKKYLDLLSHPCTAPLTDPVLPGSERGLLFRGRSNLTMTTVGGYGLVYFVPDVGTYSINMSDDSTVLTTWTPTVTPSSGAVLNTWYFQPIGFPSCTGLRSVSACAFTTFQGIETNRGGTMAIHNNYPSRNLMFAGLTLGSIASRCPGFMRVPPSTTEVLWAPTEVVDTMWKECSGTTQTHYPGHDGLDSTGILIIFRKMNAVGDQLLSLVSTIEYIPATAGVMIPGPTYPSTTMWETVMGVFSSTVTAIRDGLDEYKTAKAKLRGFGLLGAP